MLWDFHCSSSLFVVVFNSVLLPCFYIEYYFHGSPRFVVCFSFQLSFSREKSAARAERKCITTFAAGRLATTASDCVIWLFHKRNMNKEDDSNITHWILRTLIVWYSYIENLSLGVTWESPSIWEACSQLARITYLISFKGIAFRDIIRWIFKWLHCHEMRNSWGYTTNGNRCEWNE